MRALLGGLLLLLATTACAPTTGAPTLTYPPGTPRPAEADTAAIDVAVADLTRALGDQGLTLAPAERPFRPAEGPALAGAPRAVYQVVLPEAPDQGYIVIYDLPDSTAATTAGTDQATYLGTGPGRVQMPIGTHHVIRQLGSTILLYSWIPGGDADERAPRIEDALDAVGTGIPIPA